MSVGAQGRTEVLVAFVGHERRPVETHSQRTDGRLGYGGFDPTVQRTSPVQLCAVSANPEIAFHFPIINVRWLKSRDSSTFLQGPRGTHYGLGTLPNAPHNTTTF